MKTESTYKKGDAFEEKVFAVVKQLLENGDFGADSKTSKIYRKKKYRSKDSGKDVEIDISIEVYFGISEEYSILIVIECKNYESPIPARIVKEFNTTLDEIGKHNTKGIIFSKNGFQKGEGINFANSTKIGLARLDEKNEVEWICRRKSKSETRENLDETFLTSEHLQSDRCFGAFYDNQYFASLPALFQHIGVIDNYRESHLTVPIRICRREQLPKQCNHL